MRVDDSESKYQEYLVGGPSAATAAPATVSTPAPVTTTAATKTSPASSAAQSAGGSSLVSEIAKAREQIKLSLSNSDLSSAGVGGGDAGVVAQIQTLQAENRELRKVTDDLAALVKRLEIRVTSLEGGSTPAKKSVEAPVAKKEEAPEGDSDSDVDLFGSDSEDEEEAERIKAERVAAYQAKKATKKVIIAKSSVLLDVKPWDDETDMKAMEAQVRTIEMDGLVWGAAKLVPLAFGIKKLSIICVVEDDKVSIEELSEQIEEFEDFVQSVDIAAFNKI